MEIIQENTDKGGAFKAREEEKRAGVMTYVWAGPGKLIIDHTEVEPSFSGKGVGKSLVESAVEFAREKNVKILPLCTFAKSVFDKTPDFADVLF